MNRIDLVQGKHLIVGFGQDFDVRPFATTERFKREGGNALASQVAGQKRGELSFADAGVCSGDEEAVHGKEYKV